MNRIPLRKVGLTSLLAAVAATIATPFFTPFTVASGGELLHLRFGWPFRYLHQWSVLTPPDWWFPHTFPRLVDPHQNPTTILWPQFFGSVVVFALLFFGLSLLGGLFRKEEKP